MSKRQVLSFAMVYNISCNVEKSIKNMKGSSKMTSEKLLASAGRNIQEKATVIWNVANSLFGAYKPHEYGLVILPMTALARAP